MLVAVGHDPETGEVHEDSVGCSQVPRFRPLQSLANSTVSIGAGTVSQSLADQAAFFFWSVPPSAAVCSNLPVTLKCN